MDSCIAALSRTMGGRVAGKVAVVSGGSTGIGEAVTRVLASEGADVTFGGRRPEVGRRLQRTLRSEGCAAQFVAADVGTEEGAQHLVDAAAGRRGRIDALVLSAGVVLPARRPFWEVTPSAFDEVFRVNARGVFLTARAAVRYLPRGGAIVVVASIAAENVLPTQIVYSASKAAALHLARGMAVDLAARGVRVNALCPGYTDTGQTHAVLADADDPDALRADLNAAPLLRRMGTVDEMAAACLFLCSEESSYCTGTALVVDGGLTLT